MTIGEDRARLDSQFGEAYDELRRLASAVRRNDPRATITPTTLVNEAWLKLARSPGFVSLSPLHFKRIAARAMRQVLIEAARRRGAVKRGQDGVFVTFDEGLDAGPARDEDLIDLDEALKDLAALNQRQAAVVEARFFGGLEVAEIATLLDVSEATVLRDWRAARAWLTSALKD